MTFPLNTPLPALPDDPTAIEQFIVWRLQRLRSGNSHGSNSSIEADSHFMQVGVDSLEAITLIGELEYSLGRAFEPEVLFDHPTPRSLAIFLAQQMRKHP